MRVLFEGLKGDVLSLKIGLHSADLERLLNRNNVMGRDADCGKCGDCGNCAACHSGCLTGADIVSRPSESRRKK